MTDRIINNPVISSPNRVAYTDAQREAMGTLDEPLLIVACAGSGKTQVISQRIVEILKRPGVEPKNVVAFTVAWSIASLNVTVIAAVGDTFVARSAGTVETTVGAVMSPTVNVRMKGPGMALPARSVTAFTENV